MDSAYNVRSCIFKGYGILRVGVLYFKDNKKKNNKKIGTVCADFFISYKVLILE